MTMLHARIDEDALTKLINGDTVVLDTNDLATGVAVILAEIGWDRIFDAAIEALATKLRALPEDRRKALLQELSHSLVQFE